MTIAIISFFSVIIGASLQYLFTRHLENKRHYRNLRTQAYMDYLKCICDSAHCVNQGQSKVKREIDTKATDAKARICLYGSRESIQALASFQKLGSTMNTDQEQNAFTSMLSTMRKDSGSQSGARIEDLKMVLLGNHDAKT